MRTTRNTLHTVFYLKCIVKMEMICSITAFNPFMTICQKIRGSDAVMFYMTTVSPQEFKVTLEPIKAELTEFQVILFVLSSRKKQTVVQEFQTRNTVSCTGLIFQTHTALTPTKIPLNYLQTQQPVSLSPVTWTGC